MQPDRRDVLLKEYAEVSNSFRLLTDIRFRMVAFLPLAAGVAAAVVARSGSTPDTMTFGFSLFGFAVTIGLVTYNTRNDQLYGTIVARAAAIERQLGDPDGFYANRPQAWLWLGFLHWRVSHSTGVNTIYYASITLWLFGVVDSGSRVMLALFGLPPASWTALAALGTAIFLAVVGIRLVKLQVRSSEKLLRKYTRDAARAVVTRAGPDLDTNVVDALKDLARANGANSAHVDTRLRFLQDYPGGSSMYVGSGGVAWEAAQLVAYVTDCAPEWVFDCLTRRRL